MNLCFKKIPERKNFFGDNISKSVINHVKYRNYCYENAVAYMTFFPSSFSILRSQTYLLPI